MRLIRTSTCVATCIIICGVDVDDTALLTQSICLPNQLVLLCCGRQGYWERDWRDGYLRLKGVDPAHDGLLVGIDGAQEAPLTSVATGSRYYVFNLLAELDSEGEWFLSRHGETAGEQAMLLFKRTC